MGRCQMIHVYKEGSDLNKPVLLRLHGTGGTEKDLLPLAEMIDPDVGGLSVRQSLLRREKMIRFVRQGNQQNWLSFWKVLVQKLR